MTKIKVITSFNKDLWDRYANRTIGKSWIEHLDLGPDSVIEAWILGPFPENLPMQTASGTPIKYKMVETQSTAWAMFYQNHVNHPRPKTDPGQEYRFNFIPFSVKVFALAEGVFPIAEGVEHYDYVTWLDADVMLTERVNPEFLKETIGNAEMAWLNRGPPWAHGETGYIIMNARRRENIDIFLQQANLYGSGQLFYFAEWHDAFVFTSLVYLKEYMESDFIVRNLNLDMESKHKNGLYPFETSILSTKMVHYKGNTKQNV